ncbi:hypothetical protein SAMN05421505_1227 [Sinosporangium album]|uniref:Uncharacterized protein n=1 Tax=Sinosporangium album TaxID=504805 RepID=A0A1G8F1E6_9ACTN|nr:hypothetical protein [Sinosporangium album]SDH75940.1 hypothetical protein SAMN05421505_1227 [Sinosporangium album]
MNDVENTLRKTLAQAAGGAPRLSGAAAEELEKGYRRRRQRSQTLLAAAAVAVIAGGGVLGLRVGGEQGPPPAAAPLSTPSAAVTTSDGVPEPIGEVWPQAVHKLPSMDGEGRELYPAVLLDDRTLLLKAWRTWERSEAIYAYDLVDKKLRKITDLPAPKGTEYFPADFRVSDGQVAWWTASKDNRMQIWTVPLEGGEPRQVAEQKAERDQGDRFFSPSGFDLANGKITFSVRKGGVFSVPLAGGAVTPVEGGAGLHLMSWPWAGSPYIPATPDEAPYTRLVNLETGESSSALVKEGERMFACRVEWCVGTAEDGKAFTRHRNGSQQKEIPAGYQILGRPSQSRFYLRDVWDEGPGLGLYDVDTGAFADLGIRGEPTTRGEVPRTDHSGRFMTYHIKSGRYLIDLSKIP